MKKCQYNFSVVFYVCLQLRAPEWMEGDDFNTEAVMNICGESDSARRFGNEELPRYQTPRRGVCVIPPCGGLSGFGTFRLLIFSPKT